MVQNQVQLGKNGITDNFISTLKQHFNKIEDVKVVVLKSAGHDKEKVREYRDELLEKLGNQYTAKTIGFSIFVKKWRKAVR